MQGLLTPMVWDEEALNAQRVARMQALQTEGGGVLLFDDTGFGKPGKSSVGVARQYSGTFGKVTNCQVTVNCHYQYFTKEPIRRSPWPGGQDRLTPHFALENANYAEFS